MDINKVEYNGVDGTETLIDLTADTVTPETLVKGVTAHDKSGANIIGTADYAIPSTSTTSPVTDSANGMVQDLTIYGKSEVVDGDIHSAGEGYGVVRLADLTWSWWNQYPNIIFASVADKQLGLCNMICSAYQYNQNISFNYQWEEAYLDKTVYCAANNDAVFIKNTDYSTKEDFVASLGDATLAYQLADPSQGNVIAVKTDNGSGIDGNMATFTTALPLRGVSDTVRDKLTCTAESKQVETVCREVDLGTLIWTKYEQTANYDRYITADIDTAAKDNSTIICAKYEPHNQQSPITANEIWVGSGRAKLSVTTPPNEYTDTTAFKSAMSGVMLVYELATPVTTPLTSAEISAFRAIRTYDSTTNITISDEPEFEIDYLKNSDNGQAVAGIQRDLQGQIDNKITTSPLLTLTAAGWDSTTKQQTVTFAHDTSRRNVIDITIGENAAWDSAGVYAVSETDGGITFECSEIPETALTFRVTSMEVS
jgi:hypothetical protein